MRILLVAAVLLAATPAVAQYLPEPAPAEIESEASRLRFQRQGVLQTAIGGVFLAASPVVLGFGLGYDNCWEIGGDCRWKRASATFWTAGLLASFGPANIFHGVRLLTYTARRARPQWRRVLASPTWRYLNFVGALAFGLSIQLAFYPAIAPTLNSFRVEPYSHLTLASAAAGGLALGVGIGASVAGDLLKEVLLVAPELEGGLAPPQIQSLDLVPTDGGFAVQIGGSW